MPVFLSGEFHGQRSLAGCSPWGCSVPKWDTIKQQALSLSRKLSLEFNVCLSSDTQTWKTYSHPIHWSCKCCVSSLWFSSVQFSRSVASDFLWPHGLQHTRPPSPSSTGAYSDSCPLSRWCHPTIHPVVPFSCLQSFLASGSCNCYVSSLW